jgi:hypothetical protein
MCITQSIWKGDFRIMFEIFPMPSDIDVKGNEFMPVGDCYVHNVIDTEVIWAPGDSEMSDEQIDFGCL